MNLSEAQAHYLPLIDAEIRRLMAPPDGALDGFYGMMHYHLGWVDTRLEPAEPAQGKMLRPLFTLLCCQAAGGDPERALAPAAAVELVHNFSLVHDDIEDRSRTRRGRETVWAIWGEPQAINAGDALFILARNALLKLRDQGVPLPTICEAVQRLDETCLALCRGQYLDMGFETSLSVTLEAYLEMITGKTGALLACSGYLGSLVASNDPACAQHYWELGLALGLAFQIQDDLLGIWGEEALTGKASADDLRRKKKSLPVVFALSHDSRPAVRFRELYAQPRLSEDEVSEAITILAEIGARAYVEERATQQVGRAQAALAAIEASPQSKALLQELAQFLVQRDY